MRIKFVSLAECHAGCLKVLVAHSQCTQGGNKRGLMTQAKGDGVGAWQSGAKERLPAFQAAKLAD